jgi:tetrahydromethanopterin S-methyltransferase subunit C
VVFGIYSPNTPMNRGVEALQTDGFSSSNISVLYFGTPAPSTLAQDFAQKKSDYVQGGAAVGDGTGAVVAGAMGLLVGIVALAIPGVGPFKVAGPIFAALVGAGVGGLVGEIAGALMGMGSRKMRRNARMIR